MSAERADQPVPNHGIPGKTLAAEREALGWTVEQVADQLKLAVRQVIALEEGDYASLPGAAVVRGFVRAYAKIVKLDAAPLVAQIALDTGETGDTMSTAPRRDSKPATFSQSRFPSNGKRTSKMPIIVIGSLVLVVAAAVAAWQTGLIPSSLVTRTAPAAAPAGDAVLTTLPAPVQDSTLTAPGATPAVTPAEAHPPVINNSVPLISVPPTPQTTTQPGLPPAAGTPPAGAAPVAVPSAAAPAAAAAAQDALVLSVREDSWIEVRPAKKGRALFSGMVKAGTIETVTVKEPVLLVVGKPAAVSATLRGAPVALPEAPGGRVARINLQ